MGRWGLEFGRPSWVLRRSRGSFGTWVQGLFFCGVPYFAGLPPAFAGGYRVYFSGFCRTWRSCVSEGVSGVSRRRGEPEPHGGGRGVHAGVWVVWGKLVLAS